MRFTPSTLQISTGLRPKKGRVFMVAWDKLHGLKAIDDSNSSETKHSMVSVISPLRTFLNETTQAGKHVSYPTPIHRPTCYSSHVSGGNLTDTAVNSPTTLDTLQSSSAEHSEKQPPYNSDLARQKDKLKLGTPDTSKCIRSSGQEERCT